MSDTETPGFKGKATMRLGARELTRISLAVIIVIVVGLGFGLWKTVQGFKTKRDMVIAQDNLRNLFQAMKAYSLDDNSKLPAAATWQDDVTGYLSSSPARPGGKEAFLTGTSELGTVGYVFNDAAGGFNLEPNGKADDRRLKTDPHDLVLLIERAGAPRNSHANLPNADSMEHSEDLLKEMQFPHDVDAGDDASTFVLYADGHITKLTRRDLKR